MLVDSIQNHKQEPNTTVKNKGGDEIAHKTRFAHVFWVVVRVLQ